MPLPKHARRSRSPALACVLLAAAPVFAQAPDSTAPADDPPTRDSARTPATQLNSVVVRGLQPTSLPANVPTTIEGITGEEMRERINATDAEDALKYLPSLLVRKRYIGDYDHAVLATRASGTGNSARSLVYADGILLSNLLGNGASFTPRWGLVSPDEIERVDVLYGPFSAAYPGNSVGAVVDYVTRMPRGPEAHARYGYSVERFDLYRTHRAYPSRSYSASLGDRWGPFAAWISVNRLDAEAHPISFANVLADTGGADGGTPVTGAVAGSNPKRQAWYLIGATGQTNTIQDQAKLKLAYDFAPDLRLSYIVGTWRNDAFRDSQSYLTDASGSPVYDGSVSIDGHGYAIPATAMSQQRADLRHTMHGLSLKRSSGGRWDYALALSRYHYDRDIVRSPLSARPAADAGGAGRIADSAGTGWTTASASATWRPGDAHVVQFGLQHDRYTLRTEVSDTDDWIEGRARSRFSAFGGRTALSGAYVQDTWRLSPAWTAVVGLRREHWNARDGRIADASTVLSFPRRSDEAWSPKAAVEFAGSGDWSIKGSIGRAVRFPTVSELYQGSISSDAIVDNDPDLRPERSVTSELSWVRDFERGRLRATFFHEQTRDALYSQTNVTVAPSVTSIQNVGSIRTNGLELASDFRGVGLRDLDMLASVTYARSIIGENPNFPASVGKWQPRVPRWRANLLATYHPGTHWSFTTGLRYSGRQFNTLDNTDRNSDAYTGTSPFLVADMRLRYRHDAHTSVALGVDNVTGRTYWNFHPYNQRTWSLDVSVDY
jgi:iron complex outermembrane receptor protein